MESLSPTLNVAKEAAIRGAETAAAVEADKLLVSLARNAFGSNWPELFEGERGDRFARIALPLLLDYAVRNGMIPVVGCTQEQVLFRCRLAIEGASRDLIGPMLAQLTQGVAAFASSIPAKVTAARKAE